MSRVPARSWLLAAALCVGCARDASSPEARWRRAEQLWREQDLGAAFRAWRELDPRSAEGAEAQRRLAAAEVEYRRGVELLRAGAPGAREALLSGTAIAPMDPALYLPLARACRDRGLSARAAEFYRKYLTLVPADPERAHAEAEAAALDGEVELDGIFEPEKTRGPNWAAWSGGAAGLALLIAALAGARAVRRRRGPTLAARAESSPELHPALAYLIGCLRHELLKHRIGAVGDAARALDEREDPERAARREFLLGRLYGGEPLEAAWRGHLGTFERALGPRFALARDEASFRAAGRAVAELARLEPALRRGDARAAARLARALAALGAFDAGLQSLARSLVRTPLDRALVDEVVRAVRAETPDAPVTVEIETIDPELSVEVYRIDLQIILKNLIRNGVAAAARGPAPARVAVEVAVALEPTGEELVRVRVRDTSPEPLTVERVAQARLERGLGLVAATLRRYDGALEIEPGERGFAKSVTVRLFRALDDGAAREPVRAAS